MIDKIALTELSLSRAYRRGVLSRAGRPVRLPEPFTQIKRVAEQLGEPRLAELFVESQFAAMPSDWCRKAFKKPYPPRTVVFGGDCWVRYEEYLDKGVRTPL